MAKGNGKIWDNWHKLVKHSQPTRPTHILVNCPNFYCFFMTSLNQNCLQFWQLKTWYHNNQTGQLRMILDIGQHSHSQILRCLFIITVISGWWHIWLWWFELEGNSYYLCKRKFICSSLSCRCWMHTMYNRVFQDSRFSLKKKAEPTKHKPGGHIERIQKDFWFGLSLRGPLAS